MEYKWKLILSISCRGQVSDISYKKDKSEKIFTVCNFYYFTICFKSWNIEFGNAAPFPHSTQLIVFPSCSHSFSNYFGSKWRAFLYEMAIHSLE